MNNNLFIWYGEQYPLEIDMKNLNKIKDTNIANIELLYDIIHFHKMDTIRLANKNHSEFTKIIANRIISQNAAVLESKMSTTIEMKQDLNMDTPLSREAQCLYNVFCYFQSNTKTPLTKKILLSIIRMLLDNEKLEIRKEKATVRDIYGNILFTPVEYKEVDTLLDDFIRYFNDQAEIYKDFLNIDIKDLTNNKDTFIDKLTNYINAISYIYILFESIHPFEDGNGRIGRALISFFLLKTFRSIPIIFSDHLHEIGIYQSTILNEVRKTNSIIPLSEEFIKAFQASMQANLDNAYRFIINFEYIEEYLEFKHRSAKSIFMLLLLQEELVDIHFIVEKTGLSERTLTSKKPIGAITFLLNQGFIDITKKSYNKYYSIHSNIFIKDIDNDFRFGSWELASLKKYYPKFIKNTPKFIEKTSTLLDISTDFNEAMLFIFYMEYSENDKKEITTEELQNLVKELISFPKYYQEESNSLPKQSKYQQIVRNLKSNKGNSTNWINIGWVESIKNGYKLTVKGIEYCESRFK